MNCLPVRKIGFVVTPQGIVSADGAVVPVTPPLSRDDRIDAYRLGIRTTTDALEKMGFRLHYSAEHTSSMEFRGYLFDFRIQRPGQVAHITGTHADGAKKGKHGGSIYVLANELKSEFCLQMIIGKEFSAKPLYVDLSETITDPAKFIYDAVMGFLAALAEKEHRLGKATAGEFASLVPNGPKQLPEWIDV